MKHPHVPLLSAAIGLALIAGLHTSCAQAQQRDQQRSENSDDQRAERGSRGNRASDEQRGRRNQDQDRGQRGQARDDEPRMQSPASRGGQDRHNREFAPSRPGPRAQAQGRDNDGPRQFSRDTLQRQPLTVHDRADAERRAQQQRIEQGRRDADRQQAWQRTDDDRRQRERRDTDRHDRERRQARQRDDNDRRDWQRGQRDPRQQVSEQQRRQMIAEHQRRQSQYQREQDIRRQRELQRIAQLQQQRRNEQYRYQQWYWQQQRLMHQRWSRNYNAWNDPYYSTAASYRYSRDGRWYSVNQYGVDMIQQAIRHGYEAGARAGRADRMDGWRPDWRGNHAYLDANYGYYGWHVDQREYNHYFREGFRRGYEDAYYGRNRYGRHDNGQYIILASVLQAVFGVQRHY